MRSFSKLPENWSDMQEPLLEGMGFSLKYLGMTLVEKPKGEDMAANAIRRIIAMARVGAKKFQKVILTVSPRGISLQDAETKEMIECVSIYRISYCTTDKLQNKVFAYVAQSQQSGALECHAFLSPKKKIAQAVTLTVAQAFQVALEHWEAAQAGSVQEEFPRECTLEINRPGSSSEQVPGSPFKHHVETLCLPHQKAAHPSCAYHRVGPHVVCPQNNRMNWDGVTGDQAPTCHKRPFSKVSTG
ncbi:low density lipoprotein receptor adapter protein 1-like isoform X4 [Carettochelys insculpta]|uniref:low density lipoprotein receptor adapter protein 1-like isoform X4 n=1 Tax=Carettochelys insculpta TaxID=44489 RepID=UPI003EBC96D5